MMKMSTLLAGLGEKLGSPNWSELISTSLEREQVPLWRSCRRRVAWQERSGGNWVVPVWVPLRLQTGHQNHNVQTQPERVQCMCYCVELIVMPNLKVVVEVVHSVLLVICKEKLHT